MSPRLKLFFTAFSISFLGSLPIGTLNTSVANYSLKGDISGAIKFGIAAILVEVIIVRLSLLFLNQLSHLTRLLGVLSIVMCAVLFYLAYKTLLAAFHMMNFEDVLPFVSMQPFYSGLALSLLNPLHLPFWMAWTAVLQGKKVLNGARGEAAIYISAIAIGTASGFVIYGFAGDALMNTLKAQHNLINWLLGSTLLLTAIVQTYKLAAKGIKKRRTSNPA